MFSGDNVAASYLAQLLIVSIMYVGLAGAVGRARLYLFGVLAFWGVGTCLSYAVQTGAVSLWVAVAAGVAIAVVGSMMQMPLPSIPQDSVVLTGLALLAAVRSMMEAALGPQGHSGLWQFSCFALGTDWSMVLVAGSLLSLALIVQGFTGMGEWRRRWAALASGHPSLVQMGGIDPMFLRYWAAMCACSSAIVAGVLWSFLHGSVTPRTLDLNIAVTMFALLFIGGLSSAGALMASIVYIALPIVLRELTIIESEARSVLVRNALLGASFILIVRCAPAGLLGRGYRFDAEAQHADV